VKASLKGEMEVVVVQEGLVGATQWAYKRIQKEYHMLIPHHMTQSLAPSWLLSP
jgi:hypothetical protein